MWISHMDSEVNRFHPVCEKALNAALTKLSKASEYRVLHHEYTGSLEMDFVIQNIKTKQYLCVVEVKRTPADVNSARYQYQAMSYVQMNVPISEKPFYILTNLEYAFSFRYDPTRPRVFQQMLEPGLLHVGDFQNLSQAEFEERLTNAFADMISDFISDNYAYLLTLDQFEKHMKNIVSNTEQWKSSLIVLLYEYIRGAFISIGRKDLSYDVRVFKNDIERICAEAANVNFKEIFDFKPDKLEKTASVANDVLTNIFSFGKQSISGDSIADLLHSIVSLGLEHDGVVPTDPELARTVAVLAKGVSGEIGAEDYICDPAAGSGNLISAAIEVFNVAPSQIKANDINEQLLELLSLRIGLNFAKIVNKQNTAEISAKNIADLPISYFENVAVIVMNPPFVAGINCVNRKREIFTKTSKLKHRKATTDIGQMNLEGAFLEIVCALCEPGTVVACVLPKTHLVARGNEAIALRKFLLSDFGIQTIFSYPEGGLFEDVVKGTCVVVGKVGATAKDVKVVNSIGLVADIDLHTFGNAIAKNLDTKDFVSIMPGVEGMSQTAEYLLSTTKDGWRQVCREFEDAIAFQRQYIVPNRKLIKLSDIPTSELVRRKGPAGNVAQSDLLIPGKDNPFLTKHPDVPTYRAVRWAKIDELYISDGNAVCFDTNLIGDEDLLDIIDDFKQQPQKEKKQSAKEWAREDLLKLLKTTRRKTTPAYSVLIPRNLRARGKTHVIANDMVISTNFITISMNSHDDAMIVSSWISTIFYQLICEVNAKPQEGTRKMELRDIEETYFPMVTKLTHSERAELISDSANIEFVRLNKPKVRKIDVVWAKILFGSNADTRLLEAKRLLEFLANTRNPLSLSDD